MDNEAQLKLQAFLDGELPDADARQFVSRLAGDQEAAALLTELKQTREAIAGFENGVRLPESREFYWSKIKREIERQAPAKPPAPAISLLARLRYILVPAAGLALVACIAYLSYPAAGSRPPGIETALADSGAFTYHDDNAGTTLVWLSYPADSEVAVADDLGKTE